MPRDFADLAVSFAGMPAAIEQGQAKGVRIAALAITNSIRDEIRSATGGDMRISGVGRRGARVGARFDIKGTQNPTAMIRAIGPLHLLERDTQPHLIKPRSRRGAKALAIGDGFAASVEHPGTRGKHPFQRGFDRKQAEVPGIVQAEIRKAMAGTFT